MRRVAFCLTIIASASAISPDDADCDSDEAALLQSRLARGPRTSCCPGCNAACSRDECCLGIAESGWLTYPCPSAGEGLSCQTDRPTWVEGPPPKPKPAFEPSSRPEPPPSGRPGPPGHKTPMPARPKLVHACGCDCSWLETRRDDCRKDPCADRCRIANGLRDPQHCDNQMKWAPSRNDKPRNVYQRGVMKCDCQWMGSKGGLGDDCIGGCSPSDCAYMCRQENPKGTCMALSAAPAPVPDYEVAPGRVSSYALGRLTHPCGCDCSFLSSGTDDCRRSPCADRCRVANGLRHEVYCGKEEWSLTRNQRPADVYEDGERKCDCKWMSQREGLGDDCMGGCNPSGCTYKCRQANPEGTCMAFEASASKPPSPVAKAETARGSLGRGAAKPLARSLVASRPASGSPAVETGST
mmetsp:Transcript_73839/g.207353  ORF Transcript_73839/g.207353 Transcript_73839/m.207353 type:complete len:411 (+) Transcript_73839:146-1378(+)